MKRSIRRYKSFCKLQKTIQCVRGRLQDNYYIYNNEYIKEQAIRIRDNMKNCSCQMCRNERHCDWLSNNDKLTLQERKHIAQYNEWYKN